MTIEKLKQLSYLARWHKPAGFFLVWPTLWALWFAGNGHPDMSLVIIFLLGAFVMRSAGCVINDIADRHIDGHVARTRMRPLVTGKVTLQEARVFFLFLIICAVLLVFCLNAYAVLWAIAGLIFAVIYPFMKRWTHLPQVVLGIAFSWGVPMVFAAQNNIIDGRDWIVFFAAALWSIIYDTFYAMVDRPDDIKIGVKSTAILLGSYDKYCIGLLQIIFVLLLALIGYLFHLHKIYYISLIFVSALFIYQQRLIRYAEPVNCFKAFLNNHWVGFFIFLGIILSYENSGG